MRLKTRDYSAAGLYFVTICVTQRRCVLGRVNEGRVELTPLRYISRENWISIPIHFARVNLHAFVIMPNHLHGILEIAQIDFARRAPGLQRKPQTGLQGVQPASLSAIIRSFKAEVSRRAGEELQWKGRLWQPNYYDRVIRGGREFADASRYILENPENLESDLENRSAVRHLSEKARLAQHAARLQRSPWDRPS
jgi:putative transposase